jgi:hypothetical protein
VWKTILSLGTKSNKFCKWLPSKGGPLMVIIVIFENSYMLERLEGDHLPIAINGRYLKNISQVFCKKTKCCSNNGQ